MLPSSRASPPAQQRHQDRRWPTAARGRLLQRPRSTLRICRGHQAAWLQTSSAVRRPWRCRSMAGGAHESCRACRRPGVARSFAAMRLRAGRRQLRQQRVIRTGRPTRHSVAGVATLCREPGAWPSFTQRASTGDLALGAFETWATSDQACPQPHRAGERMARAGRGGPRGVAASRAQPASRTSMDGNQDHHLPPLAATSPQPTIRRVRCIMFGSSWSGACAALTPSAPPATPSRRSGRCAR